jgi:flavorubredoxin
MNHISDIMTSVLSAKYICIGSPTLNNGMLPSVSSFLTYLKGLAPKNRVGFAFGSYGWGGQSVQEIENVFESCRFDLPVRGLKLQYIPDEKDLEDFKNKIRAVL